MPATEISRRPSPGPRPRTNCAGLGTGANRVLGIRGWSMRGAGQSGSPYRLARKSAESFGSPGGACLLTCFDVPPFAVASSLTVFKLPLFLTPILNGI